MESDMLSAALLLLVELALCGCDTDTASVMILYIVAELVG